MIVMNLELDNMFGFEDFSINFSYPKKIVNSTISGEFLPAKTNFRYKKVNILFGNNASGKTSMGKALMHIFNFIMRRNPKRLIETIREKSSPACFSIDFLINEDFLYRVVCNMVPILKNGKKSVSTTADVYKANIAKKDSYESCVKKFKKTNDEEEAKSLESLKFIEEFGWFFTFPDADSTDIIFDEEVLSLSALKCVLKALDCSITDVEKLDEVENSFIIRSTNGDVIIQNEKVVDDILSSGTRMGIDISYVISSICAGKHGFFYCDEKFSFIQTDIEQFLLSIMIEKLKPLDQLFFTSHNLDLLEMNLPIHAFTFLRKDPKIKAVYPESIIKKNDVSLRNAFINDVFDIAPDLSELWRLEEVCDER